MTSLLLDTGFVLALELTNDQHHAPVTESWAQVVQSRNQLLTTTFVFAEVVTFFNGKGHHQKAVEVGNRLLQSNLVEMIQVDEALLVQGWDYFSRHQDKRYSLTDCVSFVIMTQRGIGTALALDRHFVQAGFKTLPTPA